MVKTDVDSLIAFVQERMRSCRAIGFPETEHKFAAIAALLRSHGELRETLSRVQRRVHDSAIGASPMFSVEHWKHNAGSEWPEQPDDDSYQAFENCMHPDCALARTALPAAPSRTEGRKKCDGDHAAPICGDAECWHRE